MLYIVLVIIFLLLFCICMSDKSTRSRRKNNERKYEIYALDKNGKPVMKTTGTDLDDCIDRQFLKYKDRIYDSESPDHAMTYIKAMEDTLDVVRENGYSCSFSYYQKDIESAKDYHNYLVKNEKDEEWDRKSEHLFDDLFDSLNLIVSANFKNVDIAYNSKKYCMNDYNKLMSLARKYDKTDDVAHYVNTVISSDFSFSFHPSDSFPILLDKMLESLQPLYNRKTDLNERLLSVIKSNKSMKRMELLGKEFDDYSSIEVKNSYESLLAQKLIVETRRGRYCYVSLNKSDSKTIKKNPKQTPDSKQPDRFSDLKSELIARNIEFDDKTESGGCLWVLSDASSEDFLSGFSIDGKTFSKPTHSKHFNGRSARWIK